MKPMKVFAVAACAAATLVMSARPEGRAQRSQEPQTESDPQSFRFRTGVELINVTATVSDHVRALRAGPAEGRLPRLSGRRAPADHALQQRTGAGQPRDRARHERQHGRRKNGRRARRAQPFSLRSCSARMTRCSCTGSTRDRCSSRGGPSTSALSDGPSARLQPNGGTAMYDAVADALPLAQAGTPPEEGAPHHLGRQRHEQPHGRADAQADDSRDRGAGLRDRHRQPGGARAVAEALQPEHLPAPAAACAHPVSVSIPGGRRPPPPSPPIYPPQPGPRGNNTPGTRGDEGVNVAALRDITDDSGGRTEIVRSPRDLDPGDRGHRGRAEQAGTTWDTRRRASRTGAGTRSASKSGSRTTPCARGEGSWRPRRAHEADGVSRDPHTNELFFVFLVCKAFSVSPFLRCSVLRSGETFAPFSPSLPFPPVCAIVAACDFTRPRSA